MTASSGDTKRIGGIPLLPICAIAILVLAPLALLATEALWLRWMAIMALAWWLPGVLLVALLRLPRLDLPHAALLAAGLGLCWMVSLVLLVHALPGPIDQWLLAGAYEVGALVLLVALVWRRPIPLKPVAASSWSWIALLLILAGLLRLPGLGYHELHGDEAMVLHRAWRAIEGADDVLARHAKGPGEIAVATVVHRALGTNNETTSRAPFALMGIASILATALLGRRLFSSTAGFWAGVLLAANGFALGLSRIVQYQPAVLMLSVLAVLCAWEFAQGSEGRWLVLVGVFSGFGVLMHYEFALLAPALLWLVWLGYRQAPQKGQVLGALLLAGLVSAAIVSATYLPGLLNPRFARTQRYLGNRLGGFGAFNLPLFFEMGTFYNSIYYMVGLIVLVVIGLLLGWRTARRRTLLLVLWFLPFFLLHLFVMQYPGTHFYLFMPSWALLAALPLAALTESRTLRPVLRWGLVALVALWLVLSAGYLYLAFFQQSPEYVVNYDQERMPLYWAPYGEAIPEKPRYAFPIHEGWKALGTLAGWGCLEGTFASNEGSQSLRYWYLRPLRRVEFEESPDYVFVASRVQTRFPRYGEARLEGYHHVGEIHVRGEPRIEIWAREPLPVPYVAYNAGDVDGAFNDVVPILDSRPASPPQVRALPLGGALTLQSATLAATTLAGGEVLHLDLVWKLGEPLEADYKLFVHIADGSGRPMAQWDGYPCFNMARTSQWAAGESVQDHAALTIPEEMPPGEYRVLIGLYDGTTGERLGGQAVEVATITIR